MGAGLSKNRIKGLSASVDQNSAVLILGTLPGRMSLTYGKYYADPSNKFWDILFIACGEKIDKTDQGKKQLLEKYHMDVSYGDTLEEYGLGMNNELTKKIDTADLRLAKAILTCYVRQERFCDGLWGRAIKEGTFLALLKRIDTLLTL